ncbi:CRISPR-associated Cas2 family protein [Bisgaardia hudsonensis]|uniref:CRISPR-associated endoribonuclease Cas2 n=1 Tax=Bisgaardia hudsonensis TaxID=109472 RepID=A0A4V6NQ88_9PAST|nr:CRISPR-associated endonuclease Cas2 [Bisgaardia hudsonensis]QLB13192.1 CRISPR-associated endonuclease Cas2 [Bisgaardia hudsonensis]TCP13231.1 CRISPR-associated Cas2 family protein [Bisgaardia hudsonensis]
MQYLIGYDISDEKRLQKIHRRMQKYATPIQYSVFLFEGDQHKLQECLKTILTILNKKEDDLRIYPLSKNSNQWKIGKPILPEGIIWTALT